jgi:hypothetical protein
LQTSYSSPKSESKMLSNNALCIRKVFLTPIWPFGRRNLCGGILCSPLHARFHVRKYKENLTLSSHQTETLSGGGGATLFHPAAQHNGAIAAGARDFASFRECIKFCAHALRERCISKCIVGGDAKVLLDRIQKPNGVMEKRV